MATAKQAIILRRAPGSDPTVAGCKDALVSVTHCGCIAVPVGEAEGDAAGGLAGVERTRLRFDIDCVGFNRSGDGDYSQSIGRYNRLVTEVLTGPVGSTLWLWRVLESGADLNTPAARDFYDDPDTDDYTSGTLWYLSDVAYQSLGETYPYDPPGILPYRVAYTEPSEPSHSGGGSYEFSFTLWGDGFFAGVA